MRILFLTHTLPFPPDDGMRSTCYQLVKHLSRKHETALLSLVESEEERRGASEMQKHCKRVETVLHEPPRSVFARLSNMLFGCEPFCVTQFRNEAFAAKMKELLGSGKFDAVHFLSINVSGYLAEAGRTPTVFFPHDSVSMQFFRNVPRETNLFRKVYMWSQWRKTARYEKEMIPKFGRAAVVTPVDKEWIEKALPGADLAVIPVGVDLDYWAPRESESPRPTVIFRGVMNFPPNVDAAQWFYHEILPLVRKEVPDLRYYIVGKSPVPQVQALHDGDGVIVTGLVEDLRPISGEAWAHVCPMRTGSGIKNKILEALAMAKPTVATALACDGINVQDGKHLLIADDPRAFASATVKLLKDKALGKSLGQEGRKRVGEQYGWAKAAESFERLYSEAAARASK